MGGVREVEVRHLGQIDYPDVQQLMQELQNQRLNDEIEDTLLICNHPEIVTIGPGARRDGVIVPSDYATADVDRGGGITWHGPGQLVIYPIFKWDLDEEKNVKKITSKIEQWTIEALRLLGVEATTDNRMQGVWVDGSKISSVGLAFMRWVSRHGFTINYATPKGRVETLDGCGLSAGTTTSLDRLGYEMSGDELVQALLETMWDILGRNHAKS